MSKKKKKQQQKIKLRQLSIICLFLIFTIVLLSYITLNKVILNTQLNEKTTSYISFNNSNTTDHLTISNLKVLSNNLGKSNWNKSRLTIPVKGNKNQEYEIVLYPLHEDKISEYVEVYVHNKKTRTVKKISELENNSDGGKILYQGKIDNNKTSINMWISNKYKGKTNDNSYEIKIKTK